MSTYLGEMAILFFAFIIFEWIILVTMTPPLFEFGIPIGKSEISREHFERITASKYCCRKEIKNKLYFFSKKSIFSWAAIKGIATPLEGREKYLIIKKVTVGLVAFEVSFGGILLANIRNTNIYNLILDVGFLFYMNLYLIKAFNDFKLVFKNQP